MRTGRIGIILSLAMPGASLLVAGAAPAPPAAPVVATAEGPVAGVAHGPGAVFKGIPFAAPPVGPLRWQPTAPVRPWPAVRAATAFGPVCTQNDPRGRGLPQSEDCLTLNVASPDLRGQAPVLVLIHGGAYVFGSAREGFDDAARAYARRGIVVVAANYRLGRLGFFAHPGLRAEAPGRPIGNYWLMDQIAALQWVKRNIAAFGGDPARVTILGCSAGGSSVNALMASPRARGLFAGASAHSGGGINNATRPLDQAEREGVDFARRAGVEPRGAGAAALAKLRALTPAAVLAADPGAPNAGAIVDGDYLPEETALSFARGHIARVPFIVGSTSNEASVFGLMGFDAAVMKARFGIDFDAVRRIYDPAGALPEAELIRQVQTDFIFTAGATALGALASKRQPTYAYHFAYVPPADRATAPGAPHCADMRYTLASAAAPQDAESRAVARMMEDYWVNFIRTGNPNGQGLPAWPRYGAPGFAPLLIDRQTAPAAAFRKAQLDYWHALWSRRTGEAYPGVR